MPSLSFEEAYERLRSTMPDADFEEIVSRGDIDQYGLPTGNKVATIGCYEPSLTNSLRKIGDWTFLVSNRFIANAVHKVAMFWVLHKGGTERGELELMRAMRHCFKRFYAECLVALARPPIGRTLLLESVLFERQFMDELYQLGSDNENPDASELKGVAWQVARHGILICQHHEMGHFLVSRSGEEILANATRLLDRSVLPTFQRLVESGQVALAEELFCDLLALYSTIRTENDYAAFDPSGSAYKWLHLDEVRAAYFCYVVIMQLTRVWFRAVQDARAGSDGTDRGVTQANMPRLPLDLQAEARSSLVSTWMDAYVRSRGGDVHDREAKFYFNPRMDALISRASSNLHALVDLDRLSVVKEPDREIARFLCSATSRSSSTSRFLIDTPHHRQWEGWATVVAPVEATVEDEPRNEESTPRLRTNLAIAENTFWQAMEQIYRDFAKTFDAVLADILLHQEPQDGTLDRLEKFQSDVYRRIETFGSDEDVFRITYKSWCNTTRGSLKQKIAGEHLILLTLMRKTRPMVFEMISVADRLSCLERYATRNRGENVAAFAAILLPELASAAEATQRTVE